MANHIFQNICVDFEDILQDANIKRMFRIVRDQSKTEEAKLRADIGHYKEYGQDEWCPMYFGLFTEWFAQEFLNYFGYLFNITDVKMLNSEGSAEKDYGVDGKAVTVNQKKHSSVKSIVAQTGCPVYIQVKGTLNFIKEFQTNDGSRLPNFVMNATTTAIKEGRAYQGRYILFTTGKGLYYTLKDASNDIMEVIGIDKILKLADKNQMFLNKMREQVGLSPIEITEPPIDAEARYNLEQVD